MYKHINLHINMHTRITSHAIAGAQIIRRKLSTLIYDSPLLKHTQNKKNIKENTTLLARIQCIRKVL